LADDGYESTCGADGKSGQIKDLANNFATKGKGDDTSLAGIIDLEKMKMAAPIWKERIKEQEAADKIKAEAAKAEAEAEQAAAAAKAEARAAAKAAAQEAAAAEAEAAAQEATATTTTQTEAAEAPDTAPEETGEKSDVQTDSKSKAEEVLLKAIDEKQKEGGANNPYSPKPETANKLNVEA